MKNFLTEKLMLNTKHGSDCTVEVCRAGYPDDDELIFKGAAGDGLRYILEYELPMTGDAYFSLTTNQDNYCGYNFDEIAYRMGFVPDRLREIVSYDVGIAAIIADASQRVGVASGEKAPVKDELTI